MCVYLNIFIYQIKISPPSMYVVHTDKIYYVSGSKLKIDQKTTRYIFVVSERNIPGIVLQITRTYRRYGSGFGCLSTRSERNSTTVVIVFVKHWPMTGRRIFRYKSINNRNLLEMLRAVLCFNGCSCTNRAQNG